MSTRGWAWGVPVVLLGVVALVSVYAVTTPRYALYRLGAAVQRHDVEDALRYFDVERIADRATDVLVADYLARQPAPATAAEARHGTLDRALGEFVLSVRAAASLVVIRTPPAGAHPLARALDEAELPDVIGTIAGDDTVFVATPGPSAALRLERRLRAPLAPARVGRRA